MPPTVNLAASGSLAWLDRRLTEPAGNASLTGVARFAVEFAYFAVKEARACLFAGLFFAAVFLMPRAGLWGMPRYDALLVFALAVQAWMLWAKLETLDELKAICLFHLLGFALEGSRPRPASSRGAIPTSPTPSCSARRCSRASCTPRSAATSSRRGGCSTCASAIIRRTGWRAWSLSGSTPTSSPTISSAIFAGSSRPPSWGCTPAPPSSSGRSIAIAACRCCWPSC